VGDAYVMTKMCIAGKKYNCSPALRNNAGKGFLSMCRHVVASFVPEMGEDVVVSGYALRPHINTMKFLHVLLLRTREDNCVHSENDCAFEIYY
jgi:hypothetical protein